MRYTTLALTVLAGLLWAASVQAADAPARGGRGGMFQLDPFRQLIDALGDVNLRPDFNLTKEQKEKVQAVREQVKKAEDKWRSDNAEEMKKLQEGLRQAMQDQDNDKRNELLGKMRDLMQTQPKTDEAVQQIRAILTADQQKALDTRITERQEEARGRMGGFGFGRRGGGGGN